MSKHADPFSLSFLDTLCCALGGVMMLFFLFSALSHDGVRTVGERSEALMSSKIVPDFSTSGKPTIGNIPELWEIDMPECTIDEKFLAELISTVESKKLSVSSMESSRHLVFIENAQEFADLDRIRFTCEASTTITIAPVRASSLKEKEFSINKKGSFHLSKNTGQWRVEI